MGPGTGVRIWTNPAHGGTRLLLGRYEPPLMNWLGKAVRPGTVFYDLGSNHGHIALIAAKLVGETGIVYAFEPHRTILDGLERNLALNPELASRIRVLPFEVGELHDPKAGRVSIDGVIADPAIRARPPDAMKIDVEGAEFGVVQGMAELIAQRVPVAFIECHSRELHQRINEFFASRNCRITAATPSLLEVSRHGYNSWLYWLDA
jgi:hypothetical protein